VHTVFFFSLSFNLLKPASFFLERNQLFMQR